MSPRARMAVPVVVAALAGACPTGSVTCDTNGDCLSGQVCDDKRRVCRAPLPRTGTSSSRRTAGSWTAGSSSDEAWSSSEAGLPSSRAGGSSSRTSTTGTSQPVCPMGTACGSGMVCAGGACVPNVCSALLSGVTCGTGANSNVVFTCSNGTVSGLQVCSGADKCQVNLDLPAGETAYCAQWAVMASPGPMVNLVGASVFQGVLFAIANDGHMYRYNAAGPSWSEDTDFFAKLGAFANTAFPNFSMAKAAAAVDAQLYVAGPGGALLLLTSTTGTWTRLVSGTTGALKGVSAAGGSNLNVLVGGESGAWVVNTGFDPATFVAGILQAGGSPVTTTIFSVAQGPFVTLAAGSADTVLHTPNGGAWVVDNSAAAAANPTAVVKGLLQLNGGRMAMAVDSVGNILVADFSDTSPAALAASRTWTVEWASTGSVWNGLRTFGGRVWACGTGGQVAARSGTGVTGTWSMSNTGAPGGVAIRALEVLGGELVAVGSQGTVLRYVGP